VIVTLFYYVLIITQLKLKLQVLLPVASARCICDLCSPRAH